MSSPKVLISGSGIAGSSFAHFLLKAYPKANITIVERAPSLRLTGASVGTFLARSTLLSPPLSDHTVPPDIRSNAVDIIKRAGLEPAIRAAGTNEKGMQFVRRDGSPIATLQATGRTDLQSMTSEYEIFRGELAHIFTAPILDRVRILYDEQVQSYEQDDAKVTVTFLRSQKVESFDLLVGADGYYSKIRGAMLGAKPADQVFGEGVHVAYFTIKRDLLAGSLLAKGHNAPGGRCLVLRPDPSPAGRTRGMFINANWASNKAAKERLDKAMRAGEEAYKDLMEEMFADAGWLAPEMLKGMRESDDFYCSVFAQTRSPKLQDGRVGLLGDAAHAMPGQGTSLAITGAYILAGELASLLRNPGEFAAATKRYEDLMLPFVQKQQGGDVQFAMQLANPETWWGIAIRNVVLRVVIGTGLVDLAMRVSAWLGYSEAKVDMPDYTWSVNEKE
jgi:2-polyprenyl-6-methoxyphenol hydroxylase-like FAD-dependent oxidoreductase